jgi:Na+-driven multidrug efflux pump
MVISLVRQIVVLLPVAWLLARTGELNAVWWCYPIAEVVAMAVAVGLMVRIYRRVIAPLPE